MSLVNLTSILNINKVMVSAFSRDRQIFLLFYKEVLSVIEGYKIFGAS